MSRKAHNLPLVLLCLALLSQACGAGRAPTVQALPSATADTALESTGTPALPVKQLATPTPPAISTRTPISTPTPGAVSITAVNGDIAIRTGPAVVFDAIDAIKAGTTLPVYARSIQDGWLQVPIPSRPGELGWVSSNTGFSRVDGYVLDLPLNSAVEYPFGGYVINCTAHQLVAEPGEKIIPPVGEAPANRVWFFPGLYKVYDADIAARPEITQVKVYEHTEVSVISDGNRTKYTCP